MRKPQFGLVTGLLAIFFVLALVRINFEKYIPLLPPNKLKNAPGSYMKSAVHQPVDWQPNLVDAFVRAKKLNRPVLLVLGSSTSKIGALMDSRVFSIWAVATEINDNFVPVRVDLDEDPEWENAVFPISRLKIPFLDDFQVIALDPDQRLSRFFDPPQEISQIDPTVFNDQLTGARRDFNDSQTSKDAGPAAEIQKQDRIELASQSPRQLPAFDQYAQALQDGFSPSSGVPEENAYLRLLPLAWLYLNRVGDTEALQSSLDRFLTSPGVDILRSGFFQIDESRGQLDICFAKRTLPNAGMAALLAELGATLHERFYTTLGQQTFDMLIREFGDEQLLSDGSPSDGDPYTGRSPSSSIPMSTLNQILNSSEASWAMQNLNVGQNRQQILYFSNKSSLLSPEFAEDSEKIRRKEPSPAAPESTYYADVNGNALADLCRCARLWGDPQRMQPVTDAVRSLQRFVSGFEISHEMQPSDPSRYLGDYLAYSDAQLQYFLATGQSSHFVEGKEMLSEAIKQFLDKTHQTFLSSPVDLETGLPLQFNNPQISDPAQASTTAQVIRLCHDYGRLLGPTVQGKFFSKLATDQVAKYSGLSVATSASLAGYYLAASNLADPTCAFSIGPGAVERANQLYRLRPGRLVSVVGKYVRPDLRDKAPGIYIAAGSVITGPFSVSKAADQLPKFTRVGITPNAR